MRFLDQSEGFCPQVAHEAEGVQDPHDDPAPAMTPSPPTAENKEIMRAVFSPSHWGQAMGASASDIPRSASKRVPQSAQRYSYNGISFTPRRVGG